MFFTLHAAFTFAEKAYYCISNRVFVVHIIVFGNIASGKSSICRELMPTLSKYNYTYINLDDFRRKGTGDLIKFTSERTAQAACFAEIKRSEKILLETTAASRFHIRAVAELRATGKNIVWIHADASPRVCLQRHERRMREGYVLPPFPYKFEISKSIYYFSERQREVGAHLRINTMRVKACDAARAIIHYLNL